MRAKSRRAPRNGVANAGSSRYKSPDIPAYWLPWPGNEHDPVLASLRRHRRQLSQRRSIFAIRDLTAARHGKTRRPTLGCATSAGPARSCPRLLCEAFRPCASAVGVLADSGNSSGRAADGELGGFTEDHVGVGAANAKKAPAPRHAGFAPLRSAAFTTACPRTDLRVGALEVWLGGGKPRSGRWPS